MKLLIDANILLDVLQNRAGFVEDSSLVWKLCETGQAEGIVSALTFANLVYVMRKELGPENRRGVQTLIFDFSFHGFQCFRQEPSGGDEMEGF